LNQLDTRYGTGTVMLDGGIRVWVK
jgi:hypothetical protein